MFATLVSSHETPEEKAARLRQEANGGGGGAPPPTSGGGLAIWQLLGYASEQAWVDAGQPTTPAPPGQYTAPVVSGAPYSQSRAQASTVNPEFGPSGAAFQPTEPAQSAQGNGTVQSPLSESTNQSLSLSLLFDARKAGLIDDARLQSGFADLGYTDADQQVLFGLYQQDAATTDKPTDLSLGYLFGLRSKNLIDDQQLASKLTDSGYTPGDVNLLTAFANTPDPRQLSDGVLFNALQNGSMTEQDVYGRLVDSGLSAKDAKIMIDTNKQNQIKDVGAGDLFSGWTAGQFSDTDVHDRLVKLGYTPDDATKLMNTYQYEQQQRADKASSTSTPGGGTQAKPPRPGRVVGSQGGGGQTHPQQAHQILNDFRTSFSRNLKAQSAGLSAPAKQWAMNNMDMFLNDYLGSVGTGGVDAPTFTKGAAEIQNLYEGSKGMAQASRRSGIGTTQPRNIA